MQLLWTGKLPLPGCKVRHFNMGVYGDWLTGNSLKWPLNKLHLFCTSLLPSAGLLELKQQSLSFHEIRFFFFFKLRIDGGEKAGKLSVRERGRKRSSNWPRGESEPLQCPYCSTRAIPAPQMLLLRNQERRGFQLIKIKASETNSAQSPINNELVMMCRATLWLL